jgi:hypothetical protein
LEDEYNLDSEDFQATTTAVDREIDELLGNSNDVSSEEDSDEENQERDEENDVIHSKLLHTLSNTLQPPPKKKPKIAEIYASREENEFNLRVGHSIQPSAHNGKIFSQIYQHSQHSQHS